MRCSSCPHPVASRCLGERRPDLCNRPGWRDYLAATADDFRERALASPPSPALMPVAEATRLALARNACPHGSQPDGCGCGDDLVCGARDGAWVDRATCYRCLSETPPDPAP